jgi:teichuronic acid biosynthesis glycosyltransferase TuaH
VKRMVFASHTASIGVFRVGSHHLSRELSRMGNDVVHVSTPVSLAHLAKVRDPVVRSRLDASRHRPRTDEDGVEHVVPLVALPPGSLPPRLRRANLRFPLRPWPSSARATTDVMFIDQPLLVDLIPVFRPRLVIYRPTDVHIEPTVREAERSIMRRADAIVATSEYVLQDITGGDTSVPSLVLENGVEYDRFSSGRPSSDGRRGAVYVGALDVRFDWEAVATMARAFPDEPFRIAGPLPSGPPIALPSNVQLLGAVPYGDVPDLLARSRIGLLPMSSHPTNAGRSPMKYFEYLAAGLSVVATSSPALAGRTAPNVFLFGAGRTPTQAIAEALALPEEAAEIGRQYAGEYSWEKRALQLSHFVDALSLNPPRGRKLAER